MSSVAREEIQRKTRFPERKIDLTDTNNEILTDVKRRSDVSVSDEGTKVCAPFNLLTPNVNCSGRTAPLTSKVAFYIFIQQIYLLNILNMIYTLCFFSSKCSLFHNSNVFGSCIIHIIYTGCAKI